MYASCAACNIVPENPNTGGRFPGSFNPVLKATVRVEDTKGNPVAGEQVALRKLGNQYMNPLGPSAYLDQTLGQTSDNGCLVLYEGPNLPPCNNYKVLLLNQTNSGMEEPVRDLGCRVGGEVDVNFTVPGEPCRADICLMVLCFQGTRREFYCLEEEHLLLWSSK